MPHTYEAYREWIDRKGTFPVIALGTVEGQEVNGQNILDFTTTPLVLFGNGIEIGECQVEGPPSYREEVENRRLHFAGPGIRIAREFRGQHYGKATYLHMFDCAAEQGYGFESGGVLSQHAVRMWNFFVRTGIAVMDRRPVFTYSDIQDGEKLRFHSAHYHLLDTE